MVDTVLKATGASWRTTAAGLCAGLALALPQIAHLLDNDPLTMCDWSIVMAGVAAAVMGNAARDNRVSSEAAGIKQ